MKNLNIHGYTVAKLYINQIVMSVFGLMIITASSTQGDWLIFLASLLAVGMYLFIIYSMMWDEGAKAASKTLKAEDAGVKKIKTPLITILFGSAFNIICSIFYTIFKIYITVENISEGFPTFCGNIIGLIIKLTNGIYIGFEALLFPNPNAGLPADEIVAVAPMLTPPYYYFLILIPLFAVGIFAYYLGGSEISIMKRLGFNPKEKPKKLR